MIDLTPLEVRKKKGDFRRGIRGYDQPQVDEFLDVVADRLDELVREAMALREKVNRLEQQVTDFQAREKALTEALVSAQELRADMKTQVAREADLARRQAEQEVESIRSRADQIREQEEATLVRLRGRQLQYVQTYREFLHRELSELAAVEEAIELNEGLGGSGAQQARRPRPRSRGGARARAGAAATPEEPEGAESGQDEEDDPNPLEPQAAASGPASVAGLVAADSPEPASTSAAEPASALEDGAEEGGADDDPSVWIDELLAQPQLQPVRPPPLPSPKDAAPDGEADSDLVLSDHDALDDSVDETAGTDPAIATDDGDPWAQLAGSAEVSEARSPRDSRPSDEDDRLADEILAELEADTGADEGEPTTRQQAAWAENVPAEFMTGPELPTEASADDLSGPGDDDGLDALDLDAYDADAAVSQAVEAKSKDAGYDSSDAEDMLAADDGHAVAREEAEGEDQEPVVARDGEPSLAGAAQQEEATKPADNAEGTPVEAQKGGASRDPNLGLSLVAERDTFQDFGDFSDLRGSSEFGLLPEVETEDMTNDVSSLTLRPPASGKRAAADADLDEDASDDDPEDLLSTVFGDGR